MMMGLCTEWLLFGRRFDLVAQGSEALQSLFAGFRRVPARGDTSSRLGPN